LNNSLRVYHPDEALANYLARVQDIPGLDCLVVFDEAVDRAIFDIAQHDPSDENRRSLSCMLRSLPLVHGGLGVARYSWIPGRVGVIRSRQLLADFIETHYSGCFPDVLSNLEGIQIGERNCPLPLQFGPQVAREEADDWAVLNGEVGTSELAKEQYSAVASTHIHFIADHEGMGSRARAAWFRSSQFEGSGRWLTPLATVVMDDYLLSLNANEYHVTLSFVSVCFSLRSKTMRTIHIPVFVFVVQV
jgi:hypothetical protein